MEFFDIMNKACTNEGLFFDEEKYNKFIKYKDMIKEWNEKINLTAITEDEGIVKKHFIDSIKVFRFSPLKTAKRIIDVGTGAGFPGIPIKIMIPNVEVVLLDSLNKRVNFLNEVIRELELKGITAVHGRAEDYARESRFREKFDIVVSRAVANMAVLSELCIPFVEVNGQFIALKGPAVEEEIKEGSKAITTLGGKLQQIINVEVEGTDLKHNLVVVNKIKETPKIYPRKAGTASKKPIK
ncbi:16S rRNA (guanine(527)-N(7))-methyltransferase RsmG [Clostridium sp. SYSU_GA19001]|uniref:16S rRNA (guanine(527)-N(7))-methyltransferase RsmG n=1 Tax=Clostridium caldaquaticum TaxID=2940653 RepID=UPI0020773676|nr:16S rRNA (guanine(527)-N(7))-methyltransferase RsmG [Clostridium caldaquaticum]MCM8711932.1 16S rRNA (guanine(527)-N(7))-methyltransferase RsmG [Clostridium caldaquaticum]